MVEIECLACGEAIKSKQLNDTDNYDTENYDGQVVCKKCNSLLYVKLVKGKVQKYKIVENKSEDFDYTKLAIRIQEERNQQEKGE